MNNSRPKKRPPLDDSVFSAKPRKSEPFPFVLEAVSSVVTATRNMFGCLAVYVDDKIVFCLRDKPDYQNDNGIWLATTQEHHESLRSEFPNMRSISVLGSSPTNWQLLPSDAKDFESAALRACELILDRDPRIGKIPKPRKPRKSAKPPRR